MPAYRIRIDESQRRLLAQILARAWTTYAEDSDYASVIELSALMDDLPQDEATNPGQEHCFTLEEPAKPS